MVSKNSWSSVSVVGQSNNDMFIDLDPLEEVPLIKKLIVVMEEDRSVVYWGETKYWNAKLKLRGGGEEGESETL